MIKFFLLFAIFLCANINIYAQYKNNIYGFYTGYNVNFHISDFNKIPNVPNCCPRFDNGFGNGFNLGLLYEHLFTDNLFLDTRIGISSLNGTLKKNESTAISLNNKLAEGIFEHKINGKFLNFGLDPSIAYRLFKSFNISIGTRLGINLTHKYDQIETLNTGTFVDSLGNDTHSRTRNHYSGDIPQANVFQFALLAAISYDLPLNTSNTLRLSPELRWYFPMTNVAQHIDWKISNLNVGLAFKYNPLKETPKIHNFKIIDQIDTIQIISDNITDNTAFKRGVESTHSETLESDTDIVTFNTIIRVDTLFYKKVYKFQGTITAFGVDSLGKEIPNPVFTVEEFTNNKHIPLLNYVFFDKNSPDIPDRYYKASPKEVESLHIDSIESMSTLDVYHNILNIIAIRMQRLKDAYITLTGCNDNLDAEKSNTALSLKRAESVKSYLTNVWKIDTKRIKIAYKNLPSSPSTPYRDSIKSEENRRVEITSNNNLILEPLAIDKIIETKANPQIARFKLSVQSEAGLKAWDFQAFQSSKSNNKFEIRGLSSAPDFIDWDLNKNTQNMPKAPEAIVYSINLEDSKGNKQVFNNKTLPVNIITVQKKRLEMHETYEFNSFSLILFDFDKAVISDKNKKNIALIKQCLQDESIIDITGYSDQVGSTEHNKELSLKRAQNVKDLLKRPDAIIHGMYKEKFLFDNTIPEGRFYCRTVFVTVKNKVK